MTTRSRLDRLDAALAGMDADFCPGCRAPVRQSVHPVIHPRRTLGGICPDCRRLLDPDGLPYCARVSIVAADGVRLRYARGEGFTWAADGGEVRIDAPKITVFTPEDLDGTV